MFDKELFLSLCKKYNVELSKTAKEPMLQEGNDIRPITEEDIRQIFMIREEIDGKHKFRSHKTNGFKFFVYGYQRKSIFSHDCISSNFR